MKQLGDEVVEEQEEKDGHVEDQEEEITKVEDQEESGKVTEGG